MLKILFDGVEINNDTIVSFSQTVKPFAEGKFKVGLTVCRQFDLELMKSDISKIGVDDIGVYFSINETGDDDAIISSDENGVFYTSDESAEAMILGKDYAGIFCSDGSTEVLTIPEKVLVYDDEDLYATLIVDSYSEIDRERTSFELTDEMTRFNRTLQFDTGSIINIIGQICANHGISLINQSFYMSDRTLSWGSGEISERDLIGYIAEVNGGYAYIDPNGNLGFESFSNVSQGQIDTKQCSDIVVGNKHHYDRVYLELASATKYYPETSDNDTLYLNPENILYSDNNDGYSIDTVIQHIQSVINGFEFYDVTVEKCPVFQDIRACQTITIGGFATLSTIDWNYMIGFMGGYDLVLESAYQSETKVVTAENLVKRLSIRVDRELGTISQSIANVSESVVTQISDVEQRADGLEVRVASNESNISENSDRLTAFETSVSIQSDGVRISQGTAGSYTKFTDSGMDIYAGGEKVAWAQADGFYAKELMVAADNSSSKWHITENGNSLTFYKEET